MALNIKFAPISVAPKATSITFLDTTGSYNVSTNPGGYGSENSLLSPASTGLAFILWRYWTSSDYTTYKLTSQDITNLEGSGLEINPVSAGISTDDTDVFTDGIHQVKFLPAQTLSGTGTFTSGSKLVSLSGASSISAKITNGAIVWVGANDGTVVTFYELDTTGTNNDSQLTLKIAYTGSTLTNGVIVAAEGDYKVLVKEAANACIVASTGALADIPGTCESTELLLNRLIRWIFSADLQRDCADYDGAHNLIVSINKYCQSGKCICNA